MAAANASARGQRSAILASPLHELTGFYLAVDCLAPHRNGERSFAVTDLATFQHSPERWKNRIVCREGSAWLGTMTWPSEAAARKHASNFGVDDDTRSEKGYVLIGKCDVIDQVQI